eukprot:TRINITY_DN1087_c0_g2_i1.p2 TRINITY_DN1087_c0_g2~~TRINITY_DN1087_c0_g2_i1.p2  ORF type:complete len:137 (+),score=37.94 TRINITY_DN1087_c0_g2_i1:98-508(+)
MAVNMFRGLAVAFAAPSLPAFAQDVVTDAEQTEDVSDVAPPAAASEEEEPVAPEDEEFAYENDACNGKGMSACDAAVDGCMWCDSADADFSSETYDPASGSGICMSAHLSLLPGMQCKNEDGMRVFGTRAAGLDLR